MTSSRGHLLYDEPPIAVSPTLARLLGPGKAIFLQQLHYFATRKAEDPDRYQDSYFDGRYWVYWSQRDLLKQIPIGRSIDPHKLVVASLRKRGILLVQRHRKAMWDHTNFYAIDYSRLEAFVVEQSEGQASGGKPASRVAASPPVGHQQGQQPSGAKATTLKTETTSKRTPTTYQEEPQETEVGVSLLEEAEPFRDLLIAVVHGLPKDVQQQIGDELSDRVERTSRQQAPPIGDIRAWLISLRSRVEAGEFQPSGGLRTARMRSAASAKEADAQTGAMEAAERERKAELERVALRQTLDAMDSTKRLTVAELAAACAFPGRGPKAKAVVLGDAIPSGPELVAIRKAMVKAGSNAGDAS